MTFQLTERQQQANELLAGPYGHIMLFGGSRSGKTFTLCRAIAIRAIKAPGSRHLIARFRYNHVKTSVLRDTWPKMMRLCFPELAPRCKLNSSEGFITFPPIGPDGLESQVWFGGLDDDERVEKILGNEYATVGLNECSQISSQSREMVLTRLAQNVPGLALKAYYDCNPPPQTHWTYRLFVKKRGTEPPYKPLPNPDDYVSFQMNPRDNSENLSPVYLQTLQNLSERQRRRFWEGEWGGELENALWTNEIIGMHRVKSHPDLQRVIVAIDPSGASGKENCRSDHIGIIVAGLGIDGHAYILEDLTVKGPPSVWGRIAVQAYARHQADAIIGEVNYGGAMVDYVVESAAKELGIEISFKEVRASRGKVVRAEPPSALYAQGRVHHVGTLPELEDQMCGFTSAGYTGDRSPDRADAAIWAITELFPGVMTDGSRIPENIGAIGATIQGRGSYLNG